MKKKNNRFRQNKELYIPFVIFLFCFVFMRLPFFIWMPLPVIYPDSFMMYSVASDILHNKFVGFGILPSGYILFIVITELLHFNIYTILVVQSAISFFVCMLLIYSVNKFYRRSVIFVSLALSVYMADSTSLWCDVALLTESFYRNSFIVIIAFLIIAINSEKKYHWIIFSISLIFPALIRSNGLFIYFILPVLILYFYYNHKRTGYWLCLLIPVLLLNIAWSAFNYYYEGFFFPGNPGRIKITNNLTVEDIKKDPLASAKDKSYLLLQLGNNSTEERPDFYFSILPELEKKYYKEDAVHNTANYYWPKKGEKTSFKEFFCKDNTFKNTEKYCEERPGKEQEIMVYKEYYTYENPYKENSGKFDLASTNNVWLILWHYYYKFHTYIFNSYLWITLFAVLYLLSAWKTIKSRLGDSAAFVIFCIGSIYFMALISLSIFGWYQSRYIQVSEFIIYLLAAFIPVLFSRTWEER